MKKSLGKISRLLCCALVATGMLACGEATEENQETTNQEAVNQGGANNQEPTNQEAGEESIEVAGTWSTNFGGEEVIDDENWSFMAVILFDNAENFAITQNPPDAEYAPSAYSRLVWSEPGDDEFRYCVETFGHETVDDALNADEEADFNDLEAGCGGFSFTEMTRQ